MKNKIVGMLFLLVMNFNFALASEKIIDGTIPMPFSTNQKVELANGEYYTLVGFIHEQHGAYFFHVDLKTHPWLSNNQRARYPSYPMIELSEKVDWEEYEYLPVKMIVQAFGHVETDSKFGVPNYEISLIPLAKPACLSLCLGGNR